MLDFDAGATTIPSGTGELSFGYEEVADTAAAIAEPSVAAETLGGLIRAELPKLRRLAWRLVRNNDHADDLVQDTIVRVLTYAHNWQPGTNFGAWIRTVMRNQFYTQSGSHARELMALVRDEGHDAPIAPDQDDRVTCTELAAAIDELPAAQRQAISLAAFEGLSSEEIALQMKISPNAARCHLMRGRKQLRIKAGRSKSARTDLVRGQCHFESAKIDFCRLWRC